MIRKQTPALAIATTSMFIATLLLLPGCAILQRLLGGARTPTAQVTGVRITDFSLSDLTLAFDVTVNNPYTVALPLVNIDYALASQAQPFLQGQAPLQGSIPAGQSKVITLPAKVVFIELLKVLQGVRAGAMVPYHTTLGLSVNAPVVGMLRLPIEKDGQFPVPTAPGVAVSSITWQNLSLAGATGVLKLLVANPNSFNLDVASFEYDFKLAGLDLAKGGLTSAASLVAGGSQEIGIGLSVSTQKAGMALLQVIQGKSSGYTLGGALTIGTPFGPLRIPLALSGQVPFLR